MNISNGIFDDISLNRFRPFWVMRWRKAIQTMGHGLYVAPMRQNFFLSEIKFREGCLINSCLSVVLAPTHQLLWCGSRSILAQMPIPSFHSPSADGGSSRRWLAARCDLGRYRLLPVARMAPRDSWFMDSGPCRWPSVTGAFPRPSGGKFSGTAVRA